MALTSHARPLDMCVSNTDTHTHEPSVCVCVCVCAGEEKKSFRE